MFEKARKGKGRDFCLNVVCKLVAKTLQVDKLPEALGMGGEEKKSQKCLRETRTVKLKWAKTPREAESIATLSFDDNEY